jgi:hypothetical protein
VVNHGTELAPQDTQVFRKSSGLFTLRHLLNVQQLAWSATMGDFDGDGIADLAMGHQSPGGSHTVRLFRGYRTTLHTLPISVDTGSEVEPHGLALRDIDGDGIADLVIANHGTPSEVLVGDGTGKFTSVQLLETDDVTAMVVADIDTDGDLDVLTTVGNSTANRVYRNQ